MSENTVAQRLLAKLCEQAGTLSANVLELQIRLGDATEANAALVQQVNDQGERIRSDMDLIKTLREERDHWRAIAEPSVRSIAKARE